MIKSFLYNAKDQEKSAYFWNTCAAMLNSFQTVFILMVISRIDPINDAGIFTIAFAIANLMMTIGKYGIRQFQVSDIKEKYSFKEYFSARSITVIIMILVSSCYCFYNFYTGLYDLEKTLVVFLVCLAKAVDAFEDVLHGMLQQYFRLDIAGKILSIRMGTYIVVYIVAYIITNNLIVTSAIALGVTVGQAIVLNFIAVKNHEVKKKTFEPKALKSLFVENFPLFISSYLVMYVGNAPKYAIDKVLSSEAQACFTYVFMPVFVIGLLSQFVYQPIISKVALLWNDGKLEDFKKLIFRQIGIILMLSILALIGGSILGIPLLSSIYGVDLKEYKVTLIILLLGGVALAFVNFLQMLITVVRRQKLLIIGYLIAYILFMLKGRTVVDNYGIVGISIFYSCIVLGIGIIFGILMIYITQFLHQ